MHRRFWTGMAALMVVIAGIVTPCPAQIRPPMIVRGGRAFGGAGGSGGAGVVNLPYMLNDSSGSVWRIYNGGWMQQQGGNMNLVGQGAMLIINGAQLNQTSNQGRLDASAGELVLENLVANGLSVTRHISIDQTTGALRYIDVFHNTTNQEQTYNVMVQTSINFGINSAQFIPDPKHKDQNIAWVGQTGAGQAVLEIYAGKNAKVVPNINWPQGNNFVQGVFTLTVPAGKETAIMHLHRIVQTPEAGAQFVSGMKEAQVVKTIPTPLRKLIINFPTISGWIGDLEVLRGDVLDVVELHDGDQFKGTLKEPNYTLDTFYGPVTLPVDQVIGLLSVGQFRPRQLVITSDGQIFGGHLKKETIDLQLSSGQVTQIPVAQIARVGYRKRAGEPEDWTFSKPMVLLRSGDRIAIKPLTEPLDVVTRYGRITLKPQDIAAVAFQADEGSSVHQITLTDGSKFSGLLPADTFDVTLDAQGQTAKFPARAMLKLQLVAQMPEIDELAPTIRLANDDQLVGTLEGKLSLDTAFDTISINTAEIHTMTRAHDSVQDVQVTLWDGTAFSGQLREPELTCKLASGVEFKAPVAQLEEYVQPQPQPSKSMMDKIREMVTALNSDDWKDRDRAQAALIGMGPVAENVLRQLRAGQPAETQKSIDLILQKLEDQRKKEKPNATPRGPGNAGTIIRK
jgi:hypothetical protein